MPTDELVTAALTRFGAGRLAALLVVLAAYLILHTLRWPLAVGVWVLTVAMCRLDAVASRHLTAAPGVSP